MITKLTERGNRVFCQYPIQKKAQKEIQRKPELITGKHLVRYLNPNISVIALKIS